MTGPVLIGPAGPTDDEYLTLRLNRDAWARVISREVVRGFMPDSFTRETFALLDGATKTATAILKACR
jgi:hypothetical protein